MRAVKDGLPAPYGEGEESELPRWTRAVWDSLVTPRENNGENTEKNRSIGRPDMSLLSPGSYAHLQSKILTPTFLTRSCK